ncbi:transcription factor HES-2 [Pocillopora verrucosa]|uniref:transcription factor HES-2 n=1 Tax=Pocillopora verrucosa TaxID=203993 RepID=UPI0033417F19
MGLESPTRNPSTEDRRKSSKPLMEKRRRARINQSLNELKNLILEAMKKDTSCYSKLEKADILEMTVRYLRSMRTQSAATRVSNTSDPNTMARYRAGYNECANEVSRYLMSLEGLDVQVRARLLSHLASYCTPCPPIMKPTTTTSEKLPLPQSQTITLPVTSPLELSRFTSNQSKSLETSPSFLNTTQFQIVPGQLANGKIAAVLVPSQNTPLAMVSTPHLIPVFNKPTVDFQALQGLNVPDAQALRPENDPLWRPW